MLTYRDFTIYTISAYKTLICTVLSVSYAIVYTIITVTKWYPVFLQTLESVNVLNYNKHSYLKSSPRQPKSIRHILGVIFKMYCLIDFVANLLHFTYIQWLVLNSISLNYSHKNDLHWRKLLLKIRGAYAQKLNIIVHSSI